MPKKRKEETNSTAATATAAGGKKAKVAAAGKDAMKAPDDVSFGTGILREAPFTCTLCKTRIDKGNQTLAHFKNHHKITKPAAIQKLVTLGVVLYDPVEEEEEEEDDVTAANESGDVTNPVTAAASSLSSTAQPPTSNVYSKGDIVLAHITGYPWWPGIVQKIEPASGQIDVRFFDKDMMTGNGLAKASVKDFKDYQQYLKSKRKVYSAAMLGKLRQAHDFALKVRSKPAPWRHTYFCVEKHTMFDYNANHDTGTEELEEEPLTMKPTTKPKKPATKRSSVEGAASSTITGITTAKKTATKNKATTAEEAGTTAKNASSQPTAPEKEVPDEDKDEEEDDDEDAACENDVNDVLSDLGY